MTDEGSIELAAGFSECMVDCKVAGGFRGRQCAPRRDTSFVSANSEDTRHERMWSHRAIGEAGSPHRSWPLACPPCIPTAGSLQFGAPGSIYRLLLHSSSGPKSLTEEGGLPELHFVSGCG